MACRPVAVAPLPGFHELPLPSSEGEVLAHTNIRRPASSATADYLPVQGTVRSTPGFKRLRIDLGNPKNPELKTPPAEIPKIRYSLTLKRPLPYRPPRKAPGLVTNLTG